MEQKIILCKGLPGSGKSTWSKQYCIDNPEFVRINKDDIRELIGSPKFSREIEDLVLDIQRRIDLAILYSGKSLIEMILIFQKFMAIIGNQFQITSMFYTKRSFLMCQLKNVSKGIQNVRNRLEKMSF